MFLELLERPKKNGKKSKILDDIGIVIDVPDWKSRRATVQTSGVINRERVEYCVVAHKVKGMIDRRRSDGGHSQ